MIKIPVAKPYFEGGEEKAISAVLRSGWVTQGKNVERFERIVAEYAGVKYAVATSSCTTALHISLIALDIGKGDEVILPAFTFIATANVIEYVGARPVFCDIDLESFNIDASQIESKITKKTKAIIPVHLFGLCADMLLVDKVAKKYRLSVIEDSACGMGSFYRGRHSATFGKAGCFSFHPRKAITTGEGGMIVTNNAKVAKISRILRSHGESSSDLKRQKKDGWASPAFNVLGFNYRMTDVQGALGILQMRLLDKIIKLKREKAARYHCLLNKIDWLRIPKMPDKDRHSYQSYVCLIDKDKFAGNIQKAHIFRNNLMADLEDSGIATRQGTYAVHALGFYKNKYRHKDNDFAKSFEADKLSIALPLYVTISKMEQEYVSKAIIKIGDRLLAR